MLTKAPASACVSSPTDPTKPFDLFALGGGSAGFNAARVAADMGKRLAIVDGARELHGLCIFFPNPTGVIVSILPPRSRRWGCDSGSELGLKWAGR